MGCGGLFRRAVGGGFPRILRCLLLVYVCVMISSFLFTSKRMLKLVGGEGGEGRGFYLFYKRVRAAWGFKCRSSLRR